MYDNLRIIINSVIRVNGKELPAVVKGKCYACSTASYMFLLNCSFPIIQ